MIPFLIAGILGSSIIALPITLGVAASTGQSGLGFMLGMSLFGFLGGLAGYGIYISQRSPSTIAKIGSIAISAILGFGFSFAYIYILWWNF
jgi:hypothetical protein